MLAGMLCSLLAVTALSPVTAQIGPATVRLDARPAFLGSSTLSAPPFGSVQADTHVAPIAFEATLEGVDVPELGQLIEGGGYVGGREGLEAALAPLEEQAVSVAVRFLLQLVGVSLLGGLVGVVLLRRRTRAAAARATLGGLLTVTAMLAPAVVTYNVGAFNAPRYTGALEYAPTLIGDVQTGIDRLATLREEMARISENLHRAYEAIGATRPAIADDTIRFLHISDVHLNPAAFDLAQELSEQFGVHAVIDTGDMGTWGFPFEQNIPSRVAGFEVPYLFVRGNHDNGAMEDAVAAVPNARVLDEAGTEVEGITFYGVGDPTFSPGQGYRVEEFDELKIRRSTVIRDQLQALEPPADVLLVHDSRLARYTAGTVPTVLSGHYHRFDTSVANGTRYLATGTVGGAGPDGLRAEDTVPYGAEVLYFDPVTKRPVAVDRITVHSLESSFTVERELLPEGETVFTGDPIEVPDDATPTPGEPERIVETPTPLPTPAPLPSRAPTPTG